MQLKTSRALWKNLIKSGSTKERKDAYVKDRSLLIVSWVSNDFIFGFERFGALRRNNCALSVVQLDVLQEGRANKLVEPLAKTNVPNTPIYLVLLIIEAKQESSKCVVRDQILNFFAIN